MAGRSWQDDEVGHLARWLVAHAVAAAPTVELPQRTDDLLRLLRTNGPTHALAVHDRLLGRDDAGAVLSSLSREWIDGSGLTRPDTWPRAATALARDAIAPGNVVGLAAHLAHEPQRVLLEAMFRTSDDWPPPLERGGIRFASAYATAAMEHARSQRTVLLGMMRGGSLARSAALRHVDAARDPDAELVRTAWRMGSDHAEAGIAHALDLDHAPHRHVAAELLRGDVSNTKRLEAQRILLSRFEERHLPWLWESLRDAVVADPVPTSRVYALVLHWPTLGLAQELANLRARVRDTREPREAAAVDEVLLRRGPALLDRHDTDELRRLLREVCATAPPTDSHAVMKEREVLRARLDRPRS